MGTRLGTVADRLLSVVRMSKFVAVGGVGAVCDLLVLALLVSFVGLPPGLAKIPSAETGIVVMFALNERFTFANEGAKGLPALLRRFVTSNTVRLGGVIVAWAVLVALTEWFGVWYLAANAVGLVAGVVVNYLAESLVTWKVHR